jgi:hypothetical protein
MSEGYENDDGSVNTGEDSLNEDFDDSDSDNSAMGLTGFGASGADRGAFERDDLNYSLLMGSSPYLTDIQAAIMKLPINTEYEQALIRCVNALFARERVLANNTIRKTGRFGQTDPLHFVRIFAQQALVMTRTHATQADLQAVNAAELEKQILAVFEDYISRSIGPKRERLINNEMSTRQTAVTEMARYTNEGMNNQKKKGFFGFGGR